MKKIISNGRLFGRMSFIDILVLIVALVLIAAFFVRSNVIDTPATASATENVTFDVLIPQVRDTNANLLRAGDNLYSAESGAFIGVITGVDVIDALSPETLADGTVIDASVHGRYDVILTVQTQASLSNGRFFANRMFELNANAEHRLFTKFNELGTAIIISVTGETQ